MSGDGKKNERNSLEFQSQKPVIHLNFFERINVLSSYITPFIAMMVVILLSSTALHFAQYKRRGGCCSDRIETGVSGLHGCKTCKCRKDDA
jgi:hypothetical protein